MPPSPGYLPAGFKSCGLSGMRSLLDVGQRSGNNTGVEGGGLLQCAGFFWQAFCVELFRLFPALPESKNHTSPDSLRMTFVAL
jgi:hypothetical protein